MYIQLDKISQVHDQHKMKTNNFLEKNTIFKIPNETKNYLRFKFHFYFFYYVLKF